LSVDLFRFARGGYLILFGLPARCVTVLLCLGWRCRGSWGGHLCFLSHN